MFNTTKVIFNGTEDELVEFKSRMTERSGQGLSFTITSDNSNEVDVASGQQDLITIEALCKLEERNFGPHYFPSKINSLIDIKALFKVKFKRESRSFKGNQTFSVIKINTDPKVLALYSDKINPAEEEDEFTRLAKEFSGTEEAGPSQKSAHTPLITKERRQALEVDTERLKCDLFGDSASMSTKKLKGVKAEK
ncbi:unnamed protein product [Cuscuta europaea]|uniref:Uncharacterized protein n=1 Tax=Cuscuta europaea TaxID=41803 RepID=A0A9P0ZF59_CUSEU|nr:unnamed protein product [Cuscuta europaea]